MNWYARSALMGALILCGCGGDDDDNGNPNGPGDGNGTVSATVDGSNFGGVLGTAAIYNNNALGFSAVSVSGGTTRSITFAMSPVTGAGTFSFGSVQNAGNFAVYSESTGGGAARSWQSGFQTGTGTVIITTLTATRVVGTFNFSMQPQAGSGATGTKTIANGQFDAAITPGR